MNSIIPDKLKEELEDVGKVYNSRSGICVYPNAFSRLQTEIIKVCNKNKDLEAENAELKGEADSVLNNWCKGDDPCPHLKKRDDQLTKAKELLKWALHSDPEHDEDFEQKWEEAEQFLSEVEK